MGGRRPAIPPNVAEAIRRLPPEVKRAVRSALHVISERPSAGEPLHGELRGLWKYRVRHHRIVYKLGIARTVRIVAVGERRSIYEEVAALLRAEPRIREFLEADLVDHMHVVLVPILLGRGERLWDGLEGLEERFDIEATPSPQGVVHLVFTRRAVV